MLEILNPYRNALRQIWAPLFASVALFAALTPFIVNNTNMDYDSAHFLCEKYLTADPIPYAPTRAPGSPTYDLPLVGACKIFSLAGLNPDQWRTGQRFLTTLLTVLLVFLLFSDLRIHLSNTASLFALLSFVLHPLVLWFAWAIVEDMPALVLAYLSLWLIRRSGQTQWPWAALALAVAMNAKFLAIAYALASAPILYRLGGWRFLSKFFTFTLLLGLLLYLPALVFYQMSFARAFASSNHQTHFGIRPAIGWELLKSSFFWYIPALGIWLWQYGQQLRKKKKFSLLHPADLVCIMIAVLSFFHLYVLGKFFVSLVAMAFLAWLYLRMRGDFKSFLSSNQISFLLILLVTVGIMFLAPFSRSYFLLALPAALYLLASRFQQWKFWFVMAVLAYLPMFHYFEFRAPFPFFHLYQRGFYQSHLEGQANEYNDGAMSHAPLFF